MLSVKFQSSGESLAQRHLWLPAQTRTNTAEVAVIVADVNQLSVGRERARQIFAAAINLNEQLSETFQVDHLVTSKVKNLPVCLFTGRSQQECFYCIVHIGEVSHLISIPHFERLTFNQQANPSSQKRLAR